MRVTIVMVMFLGFLGLAHGQDDMGAFEGIETYGDEQVRGVDQFEQDESWYENREPATNDDELLDNELGLGDEAGVFEGDERRPASEDEGVFDNEGIDYYGNPAYDDGMLNE